MSIARRAALAQLAAAPLGSHAQGTDWARTTAGPPRPAPLFHGRGGGGPGGAPTPTGAGWPAEGGSRWEYGASADGTRYQFTPPAAPAAAPATAPPPPRPARSPKLRVL